MDGPQSFCLSQYDYDNEILQDLIDRVNVAYKSFPDAWKLVSHKILYKYDKDWPIIKKIFDGKTFDLDSIDIVTYLARKRAGFEV
jgi:hypothetical protein